MNPLDIPSTQADKSGQRQSLVPTLLESTLLVTFLSVLLYLEGWFFWSFSMASLGIISIIPLDLPPNFYLSWAIIPSMISVMFAFIPILVEMIGTHNTRKAALIANLPLLAAAIVLFYTFPQNIPIRDFTRILFPSTLIITYIALLLHSRTIADLVLRGKRFERIIAVFALVSALLIGAATMGWYTGPLIQTNSSSTIEFRFKGNQTPVEFQGKKLILILHSDGKYIVTPYEQKYSTPITSYIIHDDQIEFAVVTTHN